MYVTILCAMSVQHGVDLEEFEEFVEFAAENPEAVQFELGASGVYEGRAFHSLAKVDEYSLGGETIDRQTREYTFPLGAWKEVEDHAGFVDPTDRPEPIEVVLSALTGCINVAVGVVALANGIDIDDLETTVRVDFDPRVILLVHDVDQSEETFSDIDIEIEVSGEDLSQEDLETLEAGARRSPVWNFLRLPHEMEPTVTTPAQATADD